MMVTVSRAGRCRLGSAARAAHQGHRAHAGRPGRSLGDRTYLATDGAGTLVIDPQPDIDRALAVHAVPGRLRDLPRGPFWVHCQSSPARAVAEQPDR
jgi:hypothetical protein